MSKKQKFIKSFGNALQGLKFLFKSELNARIELAIAFVTIIISFLFRISHQEWMVVLLCIALVLGFEGFNTAIEKLIDKLHPGIDPEIGKVKDIAAGAVLLAAIVAAIAGFIIFAPRFMDVFFG